MITIEGHPAVYSEAGDVVRNDFKTVNRDDAKSLREFFLRYRFFSTSDLAQIIDVNARTVRKWKRRAGFSGPKAPPPTEPRLWPRVEWSREIDCREWWLQHYPKYGMVVLAKSCGCSINNIKIKLRRLKIPIVQRGSPTMNHPCDTKDWCILHYCTLKLTRNKCAELAGVSRDTFSGWLDKYKIPVRTALNRAPLGKTSRVALDAPRYRRKSRAQTDMPIRDI